MKKYLVLLFAFGLISGTCLASKNEKKNKIKSITQTVTVIENGKSTSYKESYEEYDKNGKLTLKIEYKKDGSIDNKVTARYKANGDKTEEVKYDGSGRILKKTSYTYNAQGEKDTETEADAAGKIKGRDKYSYNAKNLKTEKRTYNHNNLLEAVKKWEYGYY